MINFSGFFNKKFLITLFGLFFISLVTLDPLFHDHNVIEDEHKKKELGKRHSLDSMIDNSNNDYFSVRRSSVF